MDLAEFAKILPQIAAHPLAVVAYGVLVGAWLVLAWQRQRSADFLSALELAHKKSRPKLATDFGYTYSDLHGLTREQRFKLVTRRYWLIAYLATLIAIVMISVAGYTVMREASKTNTQGTIGTTPEPTTTAPTTSATNALSRDSDFLANIAETPQGLDSENELFERPEQIPNGDLDQDPAKEDYSEHTRLARPRLQLLWEKLFNGFDKPINQLHFNENHYRPGLFIHTIFGLPKDPNAHFELVIELSRHSGDIPSDAHSAVGMIGDLTGPLENVSIQPSDLQPIPNRHPGPITFRYRVNIDFNDTSGISLAAKQSEFLDVAVSPEWVVKDVRLEFPGEGRPARNVHRRPVKERNVALHVNYDFRPLSTWPELDAWKTWSQSTILDGGIDIGILIHSLQSLRLPDERFSTTNSFLLWQGFALYDLDNKLERINGNFENLSLLFVSPEGRHQVRFRSIFKIFEPHPIPPTLAIRDARTPGKHSYYYSNVPADPSELTEYTSEIIQALYAGGENTR